MRWSLWTCLWICLVVFPAGSVLLAGEDQQIKAEVNGYPITTLDIEKRLYLNNQYGEIFSEFGGPQNPKQKALWNKMRETLIEERIFLQLAYSDGIRLGKGEQRDIDRRIKSMVRKFGSLATLKLTLKKKSLTIQDIRSLFGHQMIIRAFILKKLKNNFHLRPQEVKLFYFKIQKKFLATHKIPQDSLVATLFQKPLLEIQQIQFWRTKEKKLTRNKGEEALEALKKGADFDDVVQKYSTGIRVKKKGVWKLTEPKDLNEPEVVKALESLKVGQVSSLLPTRYGFAIVKILKHQKIKLYPFYQVQERLNQILRQKIYRRVMDNLKRRLKQKAYIKRYGN